MVEVLRRYGLQVDRDVSLTHLRDTHATVTAFVTGVVQGYASSTPQVELGLADQLTVILGEEVSTADGEVVGVFLQRTIPRGLSADETADAIHQQGGLVSIQGNPRARSGRP